MMPSRRFSCGLARSLACGAVVLAVLTLGAGCQRRETAVQIGNREKILQVGNGSEPADLDPQTITSQQDANIVLSLEEGLTAHDPKDLHPIPAAAQSWDISLDQKVYTFHLRPTARWSDGSPVTANDFLFSYRRILSPGLGSEYSNMLFVVENAEAFNAGKITDFSQVGFKVLDPLTLQVKLSYPTPYFLSLTAHQSWDPVKQPVIEKWGKWDERGTPWTQPGHYVGNGPFVLKTWRPNQIISVEKSPAYWDAAHVRLHGINFYPIGSAETEEHAFRAGELHVTTAIPIDKIAVYRREHPDLLHSDPYLLTTFFRLNVTKAPLDDMRVRRALAMSIDRQKIVADVMRGGQHPALSLVPPGAGDNYQPDKKIVEDVAAAQQLLADAGYPNGAGFPALQMILATSENGSRLAEAIQNMWSRNLHINVTLQSEESKVLQATMRELNYQIALFGWIGDYDDPNTYMSLLVSGDGNNETGWGYPEYDRLVDLAAHTPDPAARMKVFQQAEAILVDQVPIIPIYFGTHNYLRLTNVEGWSGNLLDIHPYNSVYLK
jgi:oligopeptide transport system substrate-binding protein